MAVFFVLAAFISPTLGEAPRRPQLLLAQRESAPKPSRPPRDDFDLLPKEATPDAKALQRQRELERKLAKRRTMLRFHQIGGFLTVGSLTATAVLGQLEYHDKYGGGGDVGTDHQWHRWVAGASAAIFAGTGSPGPSQRRGWRRTSCSASSPPRKRGNPRSATSPSPTRSSATQPWRR